MKLKQNEAKIPKFSECVSCFLVPLVEVVIEILEFENGTSEHENFSLIGRDVSPIYFVLYDLSK